jgi:hypothetical protein
MVVISRTLTFATILSFCSMVLCLAACSSADDGDDDDSAGGGGESGKGGAAPVGNDLKILFNPMYSGFDGENTYQIPAIVSGVKDVKWEASDPSMVDLAPDPGGGVMITTRKAGDLKIIARAGDLSGQADLHITQYTPEERAAGDARYHNNIPLVLMFPMRDPDAGPPTGPPNFMIPDDLSCNNCHGSGAMALDVEHTPQQTGGYSDDQIIGIITMGMKPPGSAYRTGIPPFLYQMFHTWGATDEEKRGLVAYLRSLSPMTQGMIDFGGIVNMARMQMMMQQAGGAAGAAGAAAGAGGAAP